MLFVIMFIKIRLNYISMPGVWFRVLYDVLRRHNRDRDGDNLWDKGNLWNYVGNGSWVIVLFDYAIISSSPVS